MPDGDEELGITKKEMDAIVSRISQKMIVQYGEAGAHFLYQSGRIGAAFAQFTYQEITDALRKKR